MVETCASIDCPDDSLLEVCYVEAEMLLKRAN